MKAVSAAFLSGPMYDPLYSHQSIISTAESLGLRRALQDVIEHHMLIPPKLACYPQIEEVIWKTVQAAIIGTVPISESLQSITQKMKQIVEVQHGQ